MFNQLEILTDEQSEKLYRIRSFIQSLNSVCIAYSGGVDSTLVASIAFEQLGSKAIAITGVSPALANTLREEARSQAKWIGVKHLEIKTSELDQASYSDNPKDRCFACKKELHKHTNYFSKKLNYKVVLDGVNLDDLQDYRPGIQAAKKAGVISPLAQFKFSKQDIRDISRALGFPWWDKPAQPCLSSRFPYGDAITSERLKMVEKAEEYLKDGGLSEVRVRCQGLTARIEIPKKEFKHFLKNYNFSDIVQYFSNLGFNCTSLDLEGLISGKLNR
ncbi:TIGR00268 family protein [Prochlorococcus marinus str. MU1404]|uniref:ATP-dependent sacrificial sulfur transferase LarE n=1 Tax=Prochlorococcus marinus TaxID=1219 RepID=UPI001ADB2555|nr:ATP-dependent sacrificial sulfur transferase LarE [Prochlorococcus marinus]MBO8230870.1 ATP-dependent sacrificial sulfur transferase LarE [Prochlorococcus marinus XMU1404]MBW3073903.1 TIGR00268 family protein [Prochlorococcus marinus str. MU1404]MCR8544798.1 ATP-dependent sacrificial sulfur transferase LarE [Prochlorococcus marinus CUG1432]